MLFRRCIAVLSIALACAGCSGVNATEELSSAKAALSAGNLEQARAHAGKAAEAAPEDPAVRETLAAIHRELADRHHEAGEFSKAMHNFALAGEFEPYRAKRAQDYVHAFESGRDEGRPNEELTPLLEASLEAVPNDAEVRRLAGSTYDELGQAKSAIPHYLWVWEADRSDTALGLRIGNLYMGLKQFDDAEAVYRRLLAVDGKNVQARLQLAEILEHRGQAGRARAIYEELDDEHDGNPSILFRYADFLQRQGDREGAEDLRAEARGELPGVKRRKMRKLRKKKKSRR